MKIYTVFDVVAKECGPLWSAKNDEVASRQFENLVSTSDISKPEDFHLYRIGDYDTETMVITPEREYISTKKDGV